MAEFHPLRSLNEKSTNLEWTALDDNAESLARSMLPASLPALDHLSYKDFDEVYEPAEDTYLFLDALRYELFETKIFAGRKDVVTTLEIGCGTGVLSVFFRNHWTSDDSEQRRPPLASFVTDINPRALQVAKETAQRCVTCEYPETLEAVQCDLASAFLPRLSQSVSVLLFNPPYVPTPDEEVGSTGIEAAWAGGKDGRRVIDRAIRPIADLLEKPDGVAYLVTVDDNRPTEMAQRFQTLGLDMRPLFRRRAHNEFLTIQKVTWLREGSLGYKPTS